jgi:hypothetical protein
LSLNFEVFLAESLWARSDINYISFLSPCYSNAILQQLILDG